MNHRTLAALGLLVGFSACTSPPETKYYTLRGDQPLKTASPAAPGPGPVVLLDRFTIDEAYADDRMAYRNGGSQELGFDPYSRWAGSTVAQVEDAVRDLLQASGAFAAVRQSQPLGETRSAYDYVVTARVKRLEEVDVSDDQWLGALDIELYLLDGKTRAVLQSVPLSDSEKAESRNPREVAAAISRLLARAVEAFVKDAKPVMASRASRGG